MQHGLLFRIKFAYQLATRLSTKSLERISVLKEKTEEDSEVSVLANALKLYEALIEETEGGNKFFKRDQNGMISIYRLWQE